MLSASAAIFFATPAVAQSPAPATYAITHAKLVTLAGSTIEDGTLVIKDGKHFIAEEIGTMNGTFLNGKKLPTGQLTPIKDGDELILCRPVLNFKTPR